MSTGTMTSFDKMLQEHLPYRLTHLDGLIWASECLLGTPRPGAVVLRFDGPADLFMVTNPLFEVGILACRLVLEFLGIKLDKANRLTNIASRHGDDLGIESLGLPFVTVPGFLACGNALPESVQGSTVRILVAADKGVAHFAGNAGGRAWAHDALVCAEAVMSRADRYVYGAVGKPIAPYRRWTEGRRRPPQSIAPSPTTRSSTSPHTNASGIE